jgi:hypothetical protein
MQGPHAKGSLISTLSTLASHHGVASDLAPWMEAGIQVCFAVSPAF